jgi:hypothetical protein
MKLMAANFMFYLVADKKNQINACHELPNFLFEDIPKKRERKLLPLLCTRVYPKVSGLTAWSENCK